MPMLQVQGLVKIYGSRRVVDGVDFDVSAGEIVGLLGPNGAGKTTSFRMACGMIEPNAGRVTLNDLDVTTWPMYRRARDGGMGYLAQESSVFRKLTVEQNLLGMMEMLASIANRAAAAATNCSSSSISPSCARAWRCRSQGASVVGSRLPAAWFRTQN